MKFFHFLNLLFGLVTVKINFREKRVANSPLKIVYSLLWVTLFLGTYKEVCSKSYGGFEEIFFNEMAVGATNSIEVLLSFVLVILIALIHVKTLEIPPHLFTALIKLTDSPQFCYDLFGDSLGKQMVLVAIFGEVGIIFMYLANIFWMYEDGMKHLWSLNPLQNSLICVAVLVFPLVVVLHFAIFFVFCIDLIRKFVKMINQKIEEALIIAHKSYDFLKLKQHINEIDKLYDEALTAIKLFEQCYGMIILILQCVCLVVGVNQVNYL